ncbi:MAG: acyl carrier protein [Nitrospirae bacterium]|nr:acyl carrier protein [Nitrospirota bacterium]MBI5694824.1 acyl carrier protein [Nitrospirota bacterium]
MSIEERVSRVLVDGLGLEARKISADASLKENLGVDSMELEEMLAALEKEFGVKVPEGVIHCNCTVRELVNYFGRTLKRTS